MRWALVAILALALASVGATSATTTDQAHRTPLRCLSTDRHLRHRFRDYPALHRELVPPKPRRLVLCRYAGLNDRHHDPGTLVRSHHVARRARIRRIARLFDWLKPPPEGPINCPADSGSKVLARFRYRGSPDDLVAQELSGCRFATNGHLVRWALSRPGPRLIDLLRRLTA
jgi:hypothetical protein